jgi:DMSO/TMAO reductase YedYZ molybdopterin-dependent catalytic subunit
MNKPSRRQLITAGITAAAGASGLVAARNLAKRYSLIPPDGGGIWGPGETLTYAAQRVLTRHSTAREFPRSEISNPPFANENAPLGPKFEKLRDGGFADWRLSVDGLVAHPLLLSIEDIKQFPSRSQITQLGCEEGWSYIAEWIGAPLTRILDAAWVLPEARYVVYRSIEPDWWESVDMDDALHPQTLVAYSMNGGELPVEFGGPIRMRVPRQLGYKSVKYLVSLTVTDNLKSFGKGLGSASPEGGYAWYAGI